MFLSDVRGPVGPPGSQGYKPGDDSDDCDDDDISDRTEQNYDHALLEHLRNLCFETGNMFYNITMLFSEAVREYNEAYTALSEELKRFHEKWKELSDDYYK